MNDLSQIATAITEKIRHYIAERKRARLENYDKKTALLLKKTESANKARVNRERALKREKVEESYVPSNWLTDAANRAKRIQLVTHAAKFTHSDARSSSLYCAYSGVEQSQFVNTASVSELSIDVVGSANALDVGKLLQLSEQGTTLIDLILENTTKPFLPLADDEEQAQAWVEQFGQVIAPTDLCSHKFAKQLYWPVADGYHLLSPLFAASLTHKVFNMMQTARFSDDSTAARHARRDGKFHASKVTYYPELAVQNFGGSNPQNISQLNSNRGGKTYLFNSAPPHWRWPDRPPLKIKSVFDGPFGRLVYRRVKELREYLEQHRDKASLSHYKNRRRQLLEDIIDELVMFRIKYDCFDAGWSQQPDCKLPLHQKLWLDQRRKIFDKDFEKAFNAKQWQREVASDFARFLNQQLESGQKLVADNADAYEWRVEAAQEIRLLTQQSMEDL